MSIVYIIQGHGKFDFSQAEKFGELKTLLERDVFPDDVEERTQAVRRIIRAKLSNFRPLYDYVLLTGDPVAILLVGIELQKRFPDQSIKFLKFDRDERTYYPVIL